MKPIAIASGQSFDPLPQGSGDENPDLVPLAFDGDPSTAWETRSYFTPLEGQKPGVGLILDLGQVQDVSKVDVRLDSVPSDIELRAAPSSATTAPTGSADDYELVQSLTGAGPTASFTPDQPVKTRFLLVWLTKLPQDSTGSYRGLISEIKAYG